MNSRHKDGDKRLVERWCLPCDPGSEIRKGRELEKKCEDSFHFHLPMCASLGFSLLSVEMFVDVEAHAAHYRRVANITITFAFVRQRRIIATLLPLPNSTTWIMSDVLFLTQKGTTAPANN